MFKSIKDWFVQLWIWLFHKPPAIPSSPTFGELLDKPSLKEETDTVNAPIVAPAESALESVKMPGLEERIKERIGDITGFNPINLRRFCLIAAYRGKGNSHLVLKFKKVGDHGDVIAQFKDQGDFVQLWRGSDVQSAVTRISRLGFTNVYWNADRFKSSNSKN
jgi:hypothetical protein